MIKVYGMLFILTHLISYQVLAQSPSKEMKQKVEPIDFEKTLDAHDRKIWNQGMMPDKSYYMGSIAGTIVGFGLGHQLQGRYSDNGAIFSIGELGSLLVGALMPIFICGSSPSPEKNNCFANINNAGVVAFSVFKIWEIYDLWYTPLKDNERYQKLKAKESHFSEIDFLVVPQSGFSSLEANLKIEF